MRGKCSLRSAVVVAVALLIWGGWRLPSASAHRFQPAPRTKLLVLVVIDQMRADYLQQYSARLSSGGFKRLTAEGAVFTHAYYPYASTETAQGHSVMLSGQSPRVTGIVGDTWYDRRFGTTVTAGESADHRLVGGIPRGGSPEQLLVHTLGDALKAQDSRTRVVTASWKRYAAVLMGGQHADAAYWFDAPSGQMVTSDYYRADYPAWVRELNAGDPTAAFFGREWLGHRFGSGTAPTADFRNDLRATPWANDVLLDFATKMVANTDIGRDDVPDVLAVSFSAVDYVGHRYGPETPEMDDTFVQMDRQVGAFLQALDRWVGKGAWTLALVADHGAALLPEKQAARGLDAGRIDARAFRAAVVQELVKRWPGTDPSLLIASVEAPEFYLDYAEGERRGVDAASLERAVADAAARQPGIARAFTRNEILAARAASDPSLRAIFEGYDPGRSGDIYMLVKPNYIFWGATGTHHGTPYEYDQHVPLIFYGAGIAPGSHSDKVLINDLAPTLAASVGVRMPGVTAHPLTNALTATAR
jgi:predicted AlkP superfamily pyrophosphatase or phosphodiesterase